MKKTTLYNVIFPLWLVCFVPPWLLLTLGGNLLIDGAVLYMALRSAGVKTRLRELQGLILRAWGLGFAADIAGAALLLFWVEKFNLSSYFIWNEPRSAAFHLAATAAAGALIYLGDYRLCRGRGYARPVCVRVGLAMGTVTAPWLFLVPTALLH